MAKTRLLQAVCTVAMLAAVPAFAQNAGTPGSNGQPAPTDQQPVPGNSSMAPANNGAAGTSSQGSMDHSTHRSAMGHRHGAASQDEAVDRLNEQSYEAAQKGQAFSASGSDNGSGGMMAPSGPGSQNGTSGGSMPCNGATGSGATGTGAATGSGGKM